MLLLLSVMVSAAAWCHREQKVQVTETMQVPGHMSMDRARAELMEKAMLRGVEQAFGTRVAVERRGTSETRNGGASKETYASGSSESLAGEWMRTDKADFTTDGEWLTLHLSGVVREFPEGRNTPKVRCMRNSKESKRHEPLSRTAKRCGSTFAACCPVMWLSICLMKTGRLTLLCLTAGTATCIG